MAWENRTKRWLWADAAISWIVALPGLVDPAAVASLFGAEEPAYSFLVRLWAGFLFLFGCLSWQASGNIGLNAPLLRYLWIQKTIVAATVLIGHLGGEAPPSLMALVMLTNLPWIPALLYADVAARKPGRSEPKRGAP